MPRASAPSPERGVFTGPPSHGPGGTSSGPRLARAHGAEHLLSRLPTATSRSGFCPSLGLETPSPRPAPPLSRPGAPASGPQSPGQATATRRCGRRGPAAVQTQGRCRPAVTSRSWGTTPTGPQALGTVRACMRRWVRVRGAAPLKEAAMELGSVPHPPVCLRGGPCGVSVSREGGRGCQALTGQIPCCEQVVGPGL